MSANCLDRLGERGLGCEERHERRHGLSTLVDTRPDSSDAANGSHHRISVDIVLSPFGPPESASGSRWPEADASDRCPPPAIAEDAVWLEQIDGAETDQGEERTIDPISAAQREAGVRLHGHAATVRIVAIGNAVVIGLQIRLADPTWPIGTYFHGGLRRARPTPGSRRGVGG